MSFSAHRAWPLLLALTMALAACGPGVGGSGTGPDPVGSTPAPSIASPPLSLHADGIDGGQVQVVLEGFRLRVQLACPRLQFEGYWNGLPGEQGRFVGLLDGNPNRSAQAEVQVSGRSLLLTLRDGNGGVLLGPVLLPQVGTLQPLGGCG
jgi:hypothetical protein